MVVILVFSNHSRDPRINIFSAGIILEPATETATSPSTAKSYKHENNRNTPYTECTAVSDSSICVIRACFFGEASVAQWLKLSDFAVLGDVAVSVAGSSFKMISSKV